MENEIETSKQTTHCLNCGTEFEGKFCPECGQSAETGRFTMRFIFENLLAAFISKDGGIWFTLKNLFTRPSAMIVEILNGKRRRFFSPFPMLICVLTVYLLLASVTGSRDNYRQAEQRFSNIEITMDDESDEQSTDAEQSTDIEQSTDVEQSTNVEQSTDAEQSTDVEQSTDKGKDYTERYNRVRRMAGNCMKFYNNHYTVIFMLTLPLFLFAARVCYGKSNRKRYYRAEYLVAITYSMVIVVIYRWLASIMYLFSEPLSDKMGIFMPLVIAVSFTACFQKMMGFSISKTAWRSVLTVMLYYLTLGLVATILIVIFGIIFIKRLG